ncbi:hypothetical protein D6C97_04328 [Aureobasidium pullulans]|nr:hypothetical protein D6C97_04328 [Aureobasidium pullulans]
MNLQSQVIAPARPALCPRWALGLCPYGHHCHLDHPNNLDPTMPKEVDYKVSNELGEACTRCLQAAIKCDKQGRDSGSDDPCSECRWFGGATCNCTLSMTSSYNDALWRGIMGRRDSDFDLAQPRDKQAAFSNGRVPAPMPDDRLKNNWQGASKDELLARKNMLPPEVRRHPRAYLVPPRESNTKKKSTAFLSRSGAHDSSRNVSISSSNTSMAPMPYGGLQQPPPPQPSAYPQGNAVVASAMHWPTGQRIQHFQSGHTVISPRQNMFSLLQNTFSAPAYGTNPTWNNPPPRLPPAPMPAMRTRNQPSTSNFTRPPPALMPNMRATNEPLPSNTAGPRPAKRQRTMSTTAQSSSTRSQVNEEQNESKASTASDSGKPTNHDDSDEEYFSAPE